MSKPSTPNGKSSSFAAKKGMKGRPERLCVPTQPKQAYSLSASGTFQEGDLTISKTGLVIQRDNGPLGAPGRPGFGDPGRPYMLPPPPEDSELPSTSTGNTPGPGRTSSGNAPEDVRLADLELISLLGNGSSGTVHKAQHKVTGKIYALKYVTLNCQEDVRKHIINELKILHKSYCPHIVRCYGAFHSEGFIKIALEYMDGGSLQDVLKTAKQIPEPYLAAISKQVLTGLKYLHKDLRIIHRDIKPGNLLISRQGEVKISDFGVSGQLGDKSKAASWVGTVTYMSPERISGGNYGFDSDIWGLGLSLVELAVGRFPYPPPGHAPIGMGFWDLLEYIVQKPAPVLPADKFSAEFCDFVAAMLQKDPKRRPSAAELLEHPFIKKSDSENIDLALLTTAAAH